MSAIESIKASLEAADAAIARAQQAIDTALSRGVNGPAYLAGLVKSRDVAVTNRDLIDGLLHEKKERKHRIDMGEQLL